MGPRYRRERLLGTLLMIVLIPLLARVALVKWWVLLPIGATAIICYVARIRAPFVILLILAGIVVVAGFFF
jgi:hypothetical protein